MNFEGLKIMFMNTLGQNKGWRGVTVNKGLYGGSLQRYRSQPGGLGHPV